MNSNTLGPNWTCSRPRTIGNHIGHIKSAATSEETFSKLAPALEPIHGSSIRRARGAGSVWSLIVISLPNWSRRWNTRGVDDGMSLSAERFTRCTISGSILSFTSMFWNILRMIAENSIEPHPYFDQGDTSSCYRLRTSAFSARSMSQLGISGDTIAPHCVTLLPQE